MSTSLLDLESQILKAIERARSDADSRLKSTPSLQPEGELKKAIADNFLPLNYSYQHRGRDSAYVFVQDVHLEQVREGHEANKGHQFGKSILGGALWLAGQPLLKKRFVTPGAAHGTSLASKYLAKALPQRMPAKILGTVVLGRAIGRAIPYVGGALIAIDVVELLVEELSGPPQGGRSFGGFGGGSFGGGGGGAGGSW
jgi:hypothetical protein